MITLKERRTKMIINQLPDDFISYKVQEVCNSISKEGEQSSYSSIFEMLYEHIVDNIEKFIPEKE
jgi:hypothetical protein